MKYTALVMAAVLVASPVTLVAQNDAAQSAAAPTAQISLDDAKVIFDQMCAGCHGYRGDGGEGHRGGFSPHIGTLANKEYMAQLPDDYLIMIIKKGGAYMGKIATMPAWEKKFSEEEIRGLVAHIRTFY